MPNNQRITALEKRVATLELLLNDVMHHLDTQTQSQTGAKPSDAPTNKKTAPHPQQKPPSKSKRRNRRFFSFSESLKRVFSWKIESVGQTVPANFDKKMLQPIRDIHTEIKVKKMGFFKRNWDKIFSDTISGVLVRLVAFGLFGFGGIYIGNK